MGCEQSVKVKPAIDSQPITIDESDTNVYVIPIVPNDDYLGDRLTVKSFNERRKDSYTSIDTLNRSSIFESETIKIDIRPLDLYAFNDVLIQQRQAAIDNIFYRKAIDSWQSTSIEELINKIQHLSSNKTIIDKAWIIFYWVSQNIEYDVVGYFSKNYTNQTAEEVFKLKKGVCVGYANIYKRLCESVDLECVKINGYGKGYGFDMKATLLTETDHAWNSIRIDNHWYLIESMWAAGDLTDDKQFKKKFDPYYFLSYPEEFIYKHLPEYEKWQLLISPISLKLYSTLPLVWPSFFKLKFELISHKSNIVQLISDKSYAEIHIRTPEDIELIGSLEFDKKKVVGGDRIYYDSRKRIWRCYFAPQQNGFHEISIYGKQKMIEDDYLIAIKYSLEVFDLIRPVTFPETSKAYYDLGLKLIKPKFQHTIQLVGDTTHVEILIETPEDVELLVNLINSNGEDVVGGHKSYFDKTNSLWR
ncbi:unnamed protein product, partial [Didymodactylos carnosus]